MTGRIGSPYRIVLTTLMVIFSIVTFFLARLLKIENGWITPLSSIATISASMMNELVFSLHMSASKAATSGYLSVMSCGTSG
jgi:hypothetical protein